MGTPAARAQLGRDVCPSATSLSDAEWALVAPFLPAPARTGGPRRWPLRALLDAILYGLRNWQRVAASAAPVPAMGKRPPLVLGAVAMRRV
jgi:hypothetical protein